MTGGKEAAALRDLIIAGLDSTKLFILTENPDRADAVLKGAADDQTFTDSFDSGESVNARETLGKYGSGSSAATRTGGGYGARGHGRKRRPPYQGTQARSLCRRCACATRMAMFFGPLRRRVWGAKFRGASADVAAKIAHQLTIDYDRARAIPKP